MDIRKFFGVPNTTEKVSQEKPLDNNKEDNKNSITVIQAMFCWHL